MIDCVGSTNPGGVTARLPGNAGAPALVGLRFTETSCGEPVSCSAFS
jgi:hypothetical protein